MSTSPNSASPIHVIGGGLAGSEAAWQIAQAGVPVVLHEMRRASSARRTDAHQTDGLAELVCSNSFRSDDWTVQRRGPAARRDARAGLADHGRPATQHQVPAGGALAVDRDGFSAERSPRGIEAHPLITIVREEVAGLPPEEWDSVIVATGPSPRPPWPRRSWS